MLDDKNINPELNNAPRRGRGRPPGSKNKLKAAGMPEQTIKELREEIIQYQARIKDLEEINKPSAGEKKAAAELIETLKTEIENMRAEIARLKTPPPAPVKKEPDFLDEILSLGD